MTIEDTVQNIVIAVVLFVGIKININTIISKINMNQTELKEALTGVAATLNKAKDEILAALAASGNTTPEVDAAVAALGDVATALDNIIPDAPVEPTE